MPKVVTIEDQIAKLDQSVEAFMRCIVSLDEELFLQKFNDWAPRDILAHLIGWNRYVIEGGKELLRGELPFYDIDPGDNYSKVNAVLIREYSSTIKEKLLTDLRRSARELKEFLRSVDPSSWDRDHGVRHAGLTITVKNTMDELIADYDHHKEQIERCASAV